MAYKNPIKKALEQLKWKKAHPNYMKDWRKAHPNYARKYRTSWIEKNPNYYKIYIQNNLEAIREKSREYRKRPEIRAKDLARRSVYRAIKSGKIIRMPCERCGEQKVEAHHDDYSKRLEVRWLCIKHHNLQHHPL